MHNSRVVQSVDRSNPLMKPDFRSGHDTTTDNNCTETQLILYIYVQINAIIIINSLDISNKNTECQSAMVQTEEHATATRTVPGSSLGYSLVFGQNLATCISCERIEKN